MPHLFIKQKKKKKNLNTKLLKVHSRGILVGYYTSKRWFAGRGNTITTDEIKTESLYQIVQQLDVLYRNAMYEKEGIKNHLQRK